jgi:hypothetical protein
VRSSYPYLNYARANGLDYGMVLSYADLVEAAHDGEPTVKPTVWQWRAMETLSLEHKAAIAEVYHVEQMWRGM